MFAPQGVWRDSLALRHACSNAVYAYMHCSHSDFIHPTVYKLFLGPGGGGGTRRDPPILKFLISKIQSAKQKGAKEWAHGAATGVRFLGMGWCDVTLRHLVAGGW